MSASCDCVKCCRSFQYRGLLGTRESRKVVIRPALSSRQAPWLGARATLKRCCDRSASPLIHSAVPCSAPVGVPLVAEHLCASAAARSPRDHRAFVQSLRGPRPAVHLPIATRSLSDRACKLSDFIFHCLIAATSPKSTSLRSFIAAQPASLTRRSMLRTFIRPSSTFGYLRCE